MRNSWNIYPSEVRLDKATSRRHPRLATRADRGSNVLMNPDEAAAQLGITVEQLLKFVGDGALKFINVGRGKTRPRRKFSQSDLDEFKAARSVLEHQSCPSSSPKNPRRTTGTVSKSNVADFSALRAARLAKKRNESKR